MVIGLFARVAMQDKVSASDSEARNMLLYSQQAVIRSLHLKIGELLQLKKERKSAFVGEYKFQRFLVGAFSF